MVLSFHKRNYNILEAILFDFKKNY